MFNLFSFTKRDNSQQRKAVAVKKTSNKKIQARKNQPSGTVELDWLKHVSGGQAVFAMLIVALLVTVSLMRGAEVMLPVEKIRLSGDFKQLDTASLKSQLKSYIGHDFLTVDIKSIQQTLGQHPWVKNVSVKRIWPNQLNVTVQEKKAVARWDKEHLLSSQAVIFKANSEGFLNLPKINGYSKQTVDLLQRYHKMQQQFSSLGLFIDELTEDRKGALRLLFNNTLLVNMGSEDNEMKIRHLLAVYTDQIKPRAEQIKQIDFRYSNGFAIAWKDEYLKQQNALNQRGNNNV